MEVELRAGRGQRRCYGCGIENEARDSSADCPAPTNIAECRLPNSGLRSSHSWQWLIQKRKKKVRSLFRGSCNEELRFGQRRGSLVQWWQLLLSPSRSNILDVTRPQANSDRVWVSLCAGQVLFDTVHLLVE